MGLQEEFEKEIHKKWPGFVPGMPEYINWLEAKLEKASEEVMPLCVKSAGLEAKLDKAKSMLTDEQLIQLGDK